MTITLGTAIARIRRERQRQIEVEGWDAAHDDKHDGGELIRAGVLYYAHAKAELFGDPPLVMSQDGAPRGWPWDRAWWKPKDPIRDLERAGALVLAELERLKRRSALAYTGHCHHRLDRIVDALGAALIMAAEAPSERPVPCREPPQGYER